MDFKISKYLPAEAICDILVVGAFECSEALTGAVSALDRSLGGALASYAKRETFEGKASQIMELMLPGSVIAHKLFVVGLGKPDEFTTDKLRKASAAAIKRASELSAKVVAVQFLVGESSIPADLAAEAIATGAILATYQFSTHKTGEKKPCSIERVDLLASESDQPKQSEVGLERGKIIAESICYARDLINSPSNVVTPTHLAAKAMEIAEEFGLECNVLEPPKMKELGMNLLMAVASGSSEEPRFISLRYKSAKAKKTVAIVGKGLTFDAGGLCIKPGRYMDSMKNDMSGGAAVLAAMRAISVLKPNVNVMCLVPATENMPGNRAVKPGDIETALSGKTVEINDTDAEGRLILADAVAYAELEKADEIIDIATLTGSCEGALGKRMAGLLATDQTMADNLISAASAGGEKLWQLPLEMDYDEALSSDFADMKNYAPEAGTITAALFIKRHIKDTPWAHLDIAGTAYSTNGNYIGAKGGTGFGVYTLVNYLLLGDVNI